MVTLQQHFSELENQIEDCRRSQKNFKHPFNMKQKLSPVEIVLIVIMCVLMILLVVSWKG